MSFDPYKFIVMFKDKNNDMYFLNKGIFSTKKQAEDRKMELMAGLDPAQFECKIQVWWCPDTEAI